MDAGNVIKAFASISSSFSGISLNSVLVFSSLQKGLERRRPVDLIHSVLGLTNIIIQGLQVSMDIIAIFFSYLFFIPSFQLFYLFSFLEASRFFVACMIAILCSFFCIKIISFQHRVIGFLKGRISGWLPWLISGSGVMSVGLMPLYIGIYNTFYPLNDTNVTSAQSVRDFSIFKDYMKSLSSVVFLPFLVILVSLASTLTSLTHHIRGAQNSSSLHSSHLRAHINAAKTMALLLVQNILFCLAHTTLTWEENCSYSGWCGVCLVLNYSSCPLQALILLHGDKRLGHTWRTFCCPTRPIPTPAKGSDPQPAACQKT